MPISYKDLRIWWLEDSFQNPLRLLQIPSNIFYINQYIYYICKYLNKIIVEKLNVFFIVNLDDILSYTNNKRKDHIETIW